MSQSPFFTQDESPAQAAVSTAGAQPAAQGPAAGDPDVLTGFPRHVIASGERNAAGPEESLHAAANQLLVNYMTACKGQSKGLQRAARKVAKLRMDGHVVVRHLNEAYDAIGLSRVSGKPLSAEIRDRIAALEADCREKDVRINGYQGSRDLAINTLALALEIEPDTVRAVEYYARLAAERIATLGQSCREKDLAHAEAMVLVLSHEGQIAKLEQTIANLRRSDESNSDMALREQTRANMLQARLDTIGQTAQLPGEILAKRIVALEAACCEKDLAQAEAMALVCSHEGHIADLRARLRERDGWVLVPQSFLRIVRHYVDCARNPERSAFIRENSLSGVKSPWAELVDAVTAQKEDSKP